ncbi:peptidylprolyl isomerase [Paraburkholderia lycopersici]|uniref:Peptidylprolyl isomerase n=1 Tax=Paraburkholderia lycopersici TaxID=416944 RepID=A0A1G6HEV6_9BURK|nr:peptidylprolyl isomerase [Paraburkholderia lycopersici]SDB92770.1 peptidylprolyl isomerase [Paraburkholderia lycopersici]
MKKAVLLTCALALSGGACAAAGTESASVVASTGDISLSQADVTAIIESLPADVRTRLRTDPSFLDDIVRGRLMDRRVLMEAHARGWDKQPQVRAQMEAAQRNAIVRSYLSSLSEPPASYPDDHLIEAVWRHDAARFTVPRALHLAQIFIPAPAGADAAMLAKARRQADDAARQAGAPGADFGAVAATYSQDAASAAKHGDLGFVPETQLLPPVRQAVDTLKPGGTSGLIRTDAGFHIVRLIEVRPAFVRPLSDVKDSIRTALRLQKQRANAQAYLATLMKQDSVKINEQALNQAFAAAH